jgi:hypothetical protein
MTLVGQDDGLPRVSPGVMRLEVRSDFPLTGQRSFLPIEAVKLHLIGVRASHHASSCMLLSARVVRAD